jgi:hypothetical protein
MDYCANTTCLKIGANQCGGCRATTYCGSGCQKAHWKQHKMVCNDKILTTAIVLSDEDYTIILLEIMNGIHLCGIMKSGNVYEPSTGRRIISSSMNKTIAKTRETMLLYTSPYEALLKECGKWEVKKGPFTLFVNRDLISNDTPAVHYHRARVVSGKRIVADERVPSHVIGLDLRVSPEGNVQIVGTLEETTGIRDTPLVPTVMETSRLKVYGESE